MRKVSQDENPHRYDDMLNLPRHISKNRKQMSPKNRAAQFMPFAALTGYDDSISNAKLKDEARIELSETQQEELNEKLLELKRIEKQHPFCIIRYYTKRKVYEYVVEKIVLHHVDEVKQLLVCKDRKEIHFDDIKEISFLIREGETK